jgi:hypothetical protein
MFFFLDHSDTLHMNTMPQDRGKVFYAVKIRDIKVLCVILDILQKPLLSSTFQPSRNSETEAYVPTISAGPVAAASLVGKPRPLATPSPNTLLPMVRHPSMPGVPSQMLHPSVQQSLMLGGATSNPPLHLQCSSS